MGSEERDLKRFGTIEAMDLNSGINSLSSSCYTSKEFRPMIIMLPGINFRQFDCSITFCTLTTDAVDLLHF